MKPMGRIVLAMVALSSFSLAVPEEGCLLALPSLTTRGQKVYQSVRITEKRPDGVTVMHQEGVARIPYEMLPHDVAVALGGFDRENAMAFRAEDRKAQAAWEAQTSRELQVLAENRRIAWLAQQRLAAENAAARVAVLPRPNPLHEPARPLGGGSYSVATSSGSDTYSSAPPVVIEVPVTTSSYCPPRPCPPEPCGTDNRPPRPPYNPCGTGNPPPRPPYNPCGTGNPPPRPPVHPPCGTEGPRNPMPSPTAMKR
ncbi:hypothetical protein KBB96_02440 [Luteolibacter ambystomatis]|uniref:Uncharacterized protein n=1 Tax=Luteolibacter ambystomatis TaxID=2824561 RepID=A0A975J0H2_9BACT|nr:hypothetical protein [Luteolibacter ambystomatis]QUE51757.1 hypothetical protein KBB96_02440 [Luteolibacter ambystomatis]